MSIIVWYFSKRKLTYGYGAVYEYVIAGLIAATWLAWTVLAGACGAGAYRAKSGEKPLGNSWGDGDATARHINANKNT